jgi:riboflavin kinase/FMN adenylyltransferase
LKVHELISINQLHFKNPVVTVGIFDGVHKGHTHLLKILKSKAKQYEGESVVITLWPHPRTILYPEKELKLLTILSEKIKLLEEQGVDHLIIIPFSKEFAQITAEEFIHSILVSKIGFKCFVVGFDNHIGRNKEGSIDVIRSESKKYGYEVVIPEPVFEGNERVSSTDIRLFLEYGEVEKAARFLGYNYSITGTVVKGKMLGRTLGYPTANLEIDSFKMLVGIGVYAAYVFIDGHIYKGMINIGFRPTVDKLLLHKSIEVNIFDFDGDLYGKQITVTFANHLRGEVKFSGIEELKQQLAKDKANSLVCLK